MLRHARANGVYLVVPAVFVRQTNLERPRPSSAPSFLINPKLPLQVKEGARQSSRFPSNSFRTSTLSFPPSTGDSRPCPGPVFFLHKHAIIPKPHPKPKHRDFSKTPSRTFLSAQPTLDFGLLVSCYYHYSPSLLPFGSARPNSPPSWRRHQAPLTLSFHDANKPPTGPPKHHGDTALSRVAQSSPLILDVYQDVQGRDAVAPRLSPAMLPPVPVFLNSTLQFPVPSWVHHLPHMVASSPSFSLLLHF